MKQSRERISTHGHSSERSQYAPSPSSESNEATLPHRHTRSTKLHVLLDSTLSRYRYGLRLCLFTYFRRREMNRCCLYTYKCNVFFPEANQDRSILCSRELMIVSATGYMTSIETSLVALTCIQCMVSRTSISLRKGAAVLIYTWWMCHNKYPSLPWGLVNQPAAVPNPHTPATGHSFACICRQRHYRDDRISYCYPSVTHTPSFTSSRNREALVRAIYVFIGDFLPCSSLSTRQHHFVPFKSFQVADINQDHINQDHVQVW